jgi:hypothetical protein
MTFDVFAHAVALDVKRRLPGVTFPVEPPGRNLRLGTAMADHQPRSDALVGDVQARRRRRHHVIAFRE